MILKITRTECYIDGEKVSTKYVKLIFPGSTDIPSYFEGRMYKKGQFHYFYGKNSEKMHLDLNWKLGDEILSNLNIIKNTSSHYETKEDFEYFTNRKNEYPSTDDMVIALWEYIVEGKEENLNILQDIRLRIKHKYPKPDLGE